MEKILKNYEIINATGSIKLLLQTEDKNFSVKTRWDLMKNMKKLEPIYNTYSELEYDLIKQYAIKDKDNNVLLDEEQNPNFSPNSKAEYLLKRNDLLNFENKVDLLTVNLSDLDGHVTNGEILYHLEFMIDENN